MNNYTNNKYNCNKYNNPRGLNITSYNYLFKNHRSSLSQHAISFIYFQLVQLSENRTFSQPGATHGTQHSTALDILFKRSWKYSAAESGLRQHDALMPNRSRVDEVFRDLFLSEILFCASRIFIFYFFGFAFVEHNKSSGHFCCGFFCSVFIFILPLTCLH